MLITGKTQQQWTGATDKLKPRHTKPPPNEWIKGRKVDEKVCLIAWLIDGERDCSQPIKPRHEESLVEYQSFDGFYNNAFKVDLGAVGKLLRYLALAQPLQFYLFKRIVHVHCFV